MKAEPIGGKLDAPLSPVGELVFVGFINIVYDQNYFYLYI